MRDRGETTWLEGNIHSSATTCKVHSTIATRAYCLSMKKKKMQARKEKEKKCVHEIFWFFFKIKKKLISNFVYQNEEKKNIYTKKKLK